MREDRYLRWVIRLLWAGLVLAGVWAGFRWVLPWLAPFLLAAILAWLLEPLIRLLTEVCRLPRRLTAALCTLATVALLGGITALLLWRLWYELVQLAGRLPTLLGNLSALADQAESWLYRLFVALPSDLREPARQAVEELARSALALPGRMGETGAAWVADTLSALPSAGLFLFTLFLATYFFSAGRPGLRAAIRQLPSHWQNQLSCWQQAAVQAAGGWLRAQGLLLLATFAQVTVGLLLLRVEPAVLLAGLTALVDALPIFGSGTVLVPWGIWALLSGDLLRGFGLLFLYGLVTLVRSLLEPRLVGRRAGLPPLVALISMYGGFRLFGILGLLLAPLAAVVIWQLWIEGKPDPEVKKGTAPKPSPRKDPPCDQC